MRKLFNHLFTYRLAFFRIDTAAPTNQAAASATHSVMRDYYHHGLCTQGRLALQIGTDGRRQLRRAQIIDAIVLVLWGGGLLSLLWLGTAAGF